MATKKAVTTVEVEGIELEVIMLPATSLLATKNVRRGLIKSRIQDLKDLITQDGGVLEPLEVEPLDEAELTANPGTEYLVNFGHYRLAAVIAANAEGHNFQLPCMITEKLDPIVRLKRQLSENTHTALTPIDKADAIKSAFDLGLSRMEVSAMFPQAGGRKGLKSQPASNSIINIYLSFLELPKKVQTLMHEGEIGVNDGMFMVKAQEKGEDLDLLIEKAQAARLKEQEKLDEEEAKYLEGEKKREEAEAKAKEAGKALEAAEADVTSGIEAVKAVADKALELYKAKMAEKDKEKKAKIEAEHKEAEKAARKAEMELDAKRKALAKEKEKADKAAEAAKERAEKLKAARDTAAKNKPAKEKAPLQVKKSAAVEQKERPNKDGIQITYGAVKKVLKDGSLPGSYPKVQKIFKAFDDLTMGRINDGQLMNLLAVITGEAKEGTAKKGK